VRRSLTATCNPSAVTLPTVTADELRRKLEDGESFVLVDALAPMVYAHSHLPGAINLPSANVDPHRVARRIPDRSTEIVVYCSSEDCEDSRVTAAKLLQLGYTNVKHYAGGKDEWRDLGLPLERAGKPYVPTS
jgi:rhodanese-related sulfurtransferase